MKCPICNNEIEVTRSLTFNNALHLYFHKISETFNNKGWEFTKNDFFTGKPIDKPWTPELVKRELWGEMQMTMFNKKSTRIVTYEEANMIIDVLNKHFAENQIDIKFPCIETFLNEQDIKNNLYLCK